MPFNAHGETTIYLWKAYIKHMQNQSPIHVLDSPVDFLQIDVHTINNVNGQSMSQVIFSFNNDVIIPCNKRINTPKMKLEY